MEFEKEKDGILRGIRVLDLADERASFCSKILADLGAYVIKVEKPQGDSSRGIGPFLNNSPDPERSLFFYHNNTNKWGITLNLEKSLGREIFLRLIQRSDVVVETFHPGYLKEIGLGFDVLREKNPKLILVSVTGFGQYGPRSQYKSCDIVASAFGGQMYLSGSSSTPPLKPFGEQSYYVASLFAAIGILLALRRRAQTGKGEHVDISLQEAVVSTLDHVMIRYFYEKTISKRQGNLYWNNSFCILPCKDGHILITLFQQWDTLIEWMDAEGMAEDLKEEKYLEETFRLKNINHIIEVIGRWTKTHTVKELFELGQLMRFPWAPIYSPKEIIDHPHLEARKFFIDVEHPEIKRSLKYPGPPYRFSDDLSTRWKRPPLLGEDNFNIYQGELGFSEDQIKKLSSLNVI